MELRGSASVAAMGLGLLALVVAGTGAAVGVAGTVVNLADPNSPTHVARVDSGGRLQVRTAEATVNMQTIIDPLGEWTFVTSPTTATLEISRVALANPGSNAGFSSTDWAVTIAQFATTQAFCSSSEGYLGTLLTYRLEPGDTTTDNLTVPSRSSRE